MYNKYDNDFDKKQKDRKRLKKEAYLEERSRLKTGGAIITGLVALIVGLLDRRVPSVFKLSMSVIGAAMLLLGLFARFATRFVVKHERKKESKRLEEAFGQGMITFEEKELMLKESELRSNMERDEKGASFSVISVIGGALLTTLGSVFFAGTYGWRDLLYVLCGAAVVALSVFLLLKARFSREEYKKFCSDNKKIGPPGGGVGNNDFYDPGKNR